MDLIPRKLYLDDFFGNFIENNDNGKMKCDIYEKNGDYHIEMDVPGFDKKDIIVEARNGYLNVSAQKTSEKNDEGKNFIRRERSFGKYERSFYLGDLDSSKIHAEFKDGTLKIKVPKTEIAEAKKIIEVK